MSGCTSPGLGVQSFDGDGDTGLEGVSDDEAGDGDVGEEVGERADEDDGEEAEDDPEEAEDDPEAEVEAELEEVGPASVGLVGVAAPLDRSQPASASSPTTATTPPRIARLVLIPFSIRHPRGTARV
jgi:hypothetical protein